MVCVKDGYGEVSACRVKKSDRRSKRCPGGAVPAAAAAAPDSFVRCHQSFWVNAEKISALVGKSFLLVDGSKVPISCTYRQSAIEEFRRNKVAVS